MEPKQEAPTPAAPSPRATPAFTLQRPARPGPRGGAPARKPARPGRPGPGPASREAGAAGGSDDGDTVIDVELLRAGSTLKHYEILRPLGRGGMGTVFLARDTKLGRLVALKVLLRHGDQGAQRFLAEARATAQCKHENIVVIHEVDELGGCPYMVLEYLEGRTLRDWLEQRRRADPGASSPDAAGPGEPVSPGLAVDLMLPVVRALACAHAQGIVHRDLKPANIVLTDAGPIKVLDFGIAKRLDAADLSALTATEEADTAVGELTRPGELLGTLPYMAPEQWRGEEVDPRTDLWAVGVLLFRLVAGAHPLAPIVSTLKLAQVGTFETPMPSVLERCPELGPLAAVIDRCLQKPPALRFGSADELLAALEPLSPSRRASALAGDQSPFAGLSAFQEADAGHFFGREREVAVALGRLRSQPLVAVAGPSGTGKSSFVRAGVIPALKRAHEPTEAFVLRPGRRPLAALAELLTELAETTGPSGASQAALAGEAGAFGRGAVLAGVVAASDGETLAALLRAQPGFLGARLRERCRRRGGRARAVLFVDQFEELYTLGADPTERAAFVACLESAADDASSPLRVLLSIRSDFLDRTAEARHFAAELTRGLVLLPPMGRDELREALLRPLEAAGHRLEGDDMARDMLDALERARSPLPLLQFTAAKLWEARDRGRRLLTRESYARIGGVAGALSAHADATLAALAPPDQALARAVLLRLVTPERTRAVVGLGELAALSADGDAAGQVVQRLANARLVLVEPSGGREGTTVELVHESLIDRWAGLRRWLDEGELDAQFLHRLRAAAQQWAAGGEAEGLLWRDRAADEAGARLARWRAEGGGAPGGGAGPGLGAREERFLRAVVALHERARRRQRRAVVALVVALGAISVLVSLLALRAEREAARANRETSRARDEAARADRGAVFARNAARMAAAREAQAADPTTALGLLREVEPSALPPAWGERALLALYGAASVAVLRQSDVVRAAAFSPDSRRIATASTDHTVQIWAADGADGPRVLRGHGGHVLSVAWSPDGERVVSASRDKTARVWRADGAGEPLVLRHEDGLYSAAFSPDGRQIATASRDKTVRVWDAEGRGEPVALRGHADIVFSVAFSPDGRRLVTASRDRTVRVWNADGTGKPLVLRGHADVIYSAAFSPDGRSIISASEDKTARIWDADAPAARAAKPRVLRGHSAAVFGAAFSPDGRRAVTSSGDTTARIWTLGGAAEPTVLRGHEQELFSASWSPDGRQIATPSLDKTVRVWDAEGGGAPLTLRGHEGEIYGGDFSPDGRRFVTASVDRTARVWNVDGSGRPLVLRGHAGMVYAAAFSPDGRRIATASIDRTVRLWNADGAGEPLVLRGHADSLYSVAFSPDGRRVASSSQDRTARVWNADGAGEPLVLRGHESGVSGVAFSPDGRQIVTASQDGTARVWAANGAGEPLVLRGHEDTLDSAAFSPDGRRIVTASKDQTARVWNADGTGEPLVLRGHESGVSAAAFSPDGRQIVTASLDKTVRVWNADGTGEPVVLRGHEGWVIAAAFSPDGRRIVSTSLDKTLKVWANFEPLAGPADPALWRATSHCLPAAQRVGLLHVPEEVALADLRACESRVHDARAAAAPR